MRFFEADCWDEKKVLGKILNRLRARPAQSDGPYLRGVLFRVRLGGRFGAMEIDLKVILQQMFRLPELGDLSCIGPEL